MKIVYIGTSDALAETVVERMAQEGNTVYLLSDKALPRKERGSLPHRFYRAPRKGEDFERLLESLSPECVVFAGSHYLDSARDEGADDDVTLLARSLRAASSSPGVRFVLLSSTEVYGRTDGRADESAERAPLTERGIRFVREEHLLDIYRQRGMDAVALRVSQPYAEKVLTGGGGLLCSALASVAQARDRLPVDVYQPVHVSDVADAVKRVAEGGREQAYNICGASEVSARRLHHLICQQLGMAEPFVRWEAPGATALASSGRIERELGWSAFHDLEGQLSAGEISLELPPAQRQDARRRRFPEGARHLAENLLIFAVFFLLDGLCGSHGLFSQINWMMIYVILVSLAYSVYQGTLAAVLASAAYLAGRNLGLLGLSTFDVYADSVLAVMQFVFLGLVVGYTANTLREDARRARADLASLQDEYEDLRAINDENVLIKNEYEERLLTSKSGFPKLYDLVSRLMVQEPDRILMETMQVVSELVSTSTVAVYQGEAGSPWLRLVGALSDGSAMDGKTWNLSDHPRIHEAVLRGELCQGELGSDEPAVVLPVVCRGSAETVILIRELPYECETLYHINLLKTMSLLLRDALEAALRYEELSRKDRYVEGTDILRPEAFARRIELAREKADKGLADYSVVELSYDGSLAEAAQVVGQTLRVTDCLGTDGTRLLALLGNVGAGNLAYLQKRLAACGVAARPVEDDLATA